MKENKEHFNPKVPLVSCSKGIIVENGMLISELIEKEMKLKYAALSGPSFAEEIIQKFPTLVVVASKDENVAQLVRMGLSTEFFKLYRSKDVVGVELAGVWCIMSDPA